MGSQILSPGLLAIPRYRKKCAPMNIGVCSSISGHASLCNSRSRDSFSGVSSSSAGGHGRLGHIVGFPARRSFVVRAESSLDATREAGENEEVGVEDASEEEGEAEAASESEVPSEEAKPRKPRVKLGDVMGILNKRAIEASEKERPVPDIRTGDVVQIKLEVPENRRRLSIYKGIVMSRQNAGIHTTIRIRRIIAGVGVEIVFPLYSPNIKEIKVVSHRKVRRARLYYLRDKLPRLSTFK